MKNPPIKSLPKKVALVHEWFSPYSYGGAEQVVKEINELLLNLGCLPEYLALVDGESCRKDSWLYEKKVQTSFIQRLPFGVRKVQSFFPLLPLAIEQLNLSEFPVIVSSSHLVAKGVITSPDQFHISYVHTPARYAWDQMHIYLNQSSLARLGLGPLIRWHLHQFRQWDQLSGARVNALIANSNFTARRISHYWGRESKVIFPPVSVDRFKWDLPRNDFYLCVCRLVPNKRVDLLIEAFNRLKLPLIVVGNGPQFNYLKKSAKSNIQLLGSQSQKKVETLMSECKAFVYAGIEDFGIAPVEAMASGAPVIALAKGGLLDTVRCTNKFNNGPTGLLFPEQTADSLVQAIEWFENKKLWKSMRPELIRNWAEEFRPEIFATKFEKEIEKAFSTFQERF